MLIQNASYDFIFFKLKNILLTYLVDFLLVLL